MQNTDSGAVSILHKFFPSALVFKKHAIIYIFLSSVSPPRDLSGNLTREASICGIKRGQQMKGHSICGLSKHRIQKKISGRCCFIHANAVTMQFQRLISWSHRLTTWSNSTCYPKGVSVTHTDTHLTSRASTCVSFLARACCRTVE